MSFPLAFSLNFFSVYPCCLLQFPPLFLSRCIPYLSPFHPLCRYHIVTLPVDSFTLLSPFVSPLPLSLPTSLSICVFLSFFSVAHPSLSPSLYFPLSLCLSIARCGFPFLSPPLPYVCFVSPSVVSSLTLHCSESHCLSLHPIYLLSDWGVQRDGLQRGRHCYKISLGENAI